jgi:hypothetical protein
VEGEQFDGRHAPFVNRRIPKRIDQRRDGAVMIDRASRGLMPS